MNQGSGVVNFLAAPHFAGHRKQEKGSPPPPPGNTTGNLTGLSFSAGKTVSRLAKGNRSNVSLAGL
jgi:hypothetical protein